MYCPCYTLLNAYKSTFVSSFQRDYFRLPVLKSYPFTSRYSNSPHNPGIGKSPTTTTSQAKESYTSLYLKPQTAILPDRNSQHWLWLECPWRYVLDAKRIAVFTSDAYYKVALSIHIQPLSCIALSYCHGLFFLPMTANFCSGLPTTYHKQRLTIAHC